MDEYLDEEVESLKQAFEVIIRTWSKSVRPHSPPFLYLKSNTLIPRTPPKRASSAHRIPP